MRSVNPATDETHEYPDHGSVEIADRLSRAHAAARTWRATTLDDRAARMRALAALLVEQRETLARVMTAEMGKAVVESRAEVDKCAWVCNYYADHAREHLADVDVETDATRSFVTFQPLGVVLAIMPWNFPFWQVFRFLAPALMAGNTGLLKHASNVPGCALAIEGLVREAGFPDDVFHTLLIGSSHVAGLIADPRVAAVTLTGSTEAGRNVGSVAGQHLKKAVLELGGSDPYLVLGDANLTEAAQACATARLINAGQSCIAGKRFVVVEAVREPFEKLFVAEMASYRMGDPLDEDTQVGPMARADLRDELHDQVVRSQAAGARLLLGGVVPNGPGAFYPPTVLTDVGPGAAVYQEEVFGPVAAVISARDERDAVRIANDSPFGLGAAVFTADAGRGTTIATSHVEAGNCFVNTFVRSDPRLPFGGVKESGFGRELSAFGIREFVNVKTVYVR